MDDLIVQILQINKAKQLECVLQILKGLVIIKAGGVFSNTQKQYSWVV